MQQNNFPKLHNATWPGVVGKGPDSEPPILLDTMLEYTAKAEVDGIKFDGVDVGLFDPSIDLDDADGPKKLADKVSKHNLVIGSLVAPIWGGPILGSEDDRKFYLDQVKKSCAFAQKLNDIGIRTYGVVRVDSASAPEAWAKDPANSQKLIVDTFQKAADIAADYGEKLAAEGEICWAGMHSWKIMLDTLQSVNKSNFGFQADMAHSFLYLLGYNAPEDRILPENFEWSDRATLEESLKKLTAALRPYVIDFHVAQNDGTVHGTGSHDKTGRHCLATDPNGKLDIIKDAGWWLRDENGALTKAVKHICWDGCMFPNEVMHKQQTWNDILAAMIKVRSAHGWD